MATDRMQGILKHGGLKIYAKKQALAGLDDWLFVPIAYLSIKEDPEICKQLVLAFVGKFVSMPIKSALGWAEAETLRYARRLLFPFTPEELSAHLRRSDRQTRRVLQNLVDLHLLEVVNARQRYRSYRLPEVASAANGHRSSLARQIGKI
jgi:hypothetical protein